MAQPPLAQADCTEAELREHYALTTLSRLGVSFERAMTIETVRITLAGAIKAKRRVAALRARESAIPHQIQEAA